MYQGLHDDQGWHKPQDPHRACNALLDTLCRASAPPRHLVFLAASRIDHKSSELEHWGRGYGQVNFRLPFTDSVCACRSLLPHLEVVQATLSRIRTITYRILAGFRWSLTAAAFENLLLAPYVTRKLWFHGLLAMIDSILPCCIWDQGTSALLEISSSEGLEDEAVHLVARLTAPRGTCRSGEIVLHFDTSSNHLNEHGRH